MVGELMLMTLFVLQKRNLPVKKILKIKGKADENEEKEISSYVKRFCNTLR